MMDHPWIGTLAQAESLVPFDEVYTREELRRLKEEVVGPSFESYTYGGKLWALPVDAACHVFVYRADLLAKADAAVPQDWDAVLALSERLHHPPDQYALCLSLDFNLFLSLAATFGSVPYADPQRAVLPPDQGLRVLKLMKQLQRYCYPGPGAASEVMTASDLVCMCPSSFGTVTYSYPRDGKKGLSYAPVPGPSRGTRGHSILGGMGLGIPAASRHREEAVRYARFVMSPEAQVGIFPANEGQPGLLAAWTNPSVQSKTGSFYPAMSECMSSAYPQPNFPGWMSGFHESAEVLRRYMQGSLEPEQVLSEFEQIRSWHVGRVPGATRQ
jgi:multiple sugar transport system substrate-binding protein